MADIKIKVTPDADSTGATEVDESVNIQISLEARKTLDGKIMITDHRDMDIVIDTEGKKIITFPKSEMSDEVYQTQNNYFNFLSAKGVIERASVHGGDVFASIQAQYPDPLDEGISAPQLVLLSTYKFIEEERPRFETEEFYEDEIEDWYTTPTPEDSTPLGQVPEKPRKGSISPFSSYYMPNAYYTYE